MKCTRFCSLLILILFVNCSKPEKSVKVLQVPGKDQFCVVDENGISVLPSGRYATPVGEQIRITNDPYGMDISPDGEKAVTLHNGIFTIIDLNSLEQIRIPSYDGKITSPLSKGSFLGALYGSCKHE